MNTYALAFIAPLLLSSTTLAQSGSMINIDQGARIICPYDDCYLTFVDESLCDFLRSVFDDAITSFSNNRNCIAVDDYSYDCLNILSRRRYSEERETEYSDPYILQLMTEFQVRLDICLSGWRKNIVFDERRQLVVYVWGAETVAIALSEINIQQVNYDRLTLELRR